MKVDSKLLIGAGIGLILLSLGSDSLNGLAAFRGNSSGPAFDSTKLKSLMKSHPWIKLYTAAVFAPPLSGPYWVMDQQAIRAVPALRKTGNSTNISAVNKAKAAHAMPMITKATNVGQMEAMIVSMKSVRDKARGYTTLSAPMSRGSSAGMWLVPSEAARYVKYLDEAISKSEDALAKAAAKKADASDKQAALDTLKELTAFTEGGITPPSDTVTDTGPALVVNDWRELMRQAEERSQAAAAQARATPPTAQSQMQLIKQNTSVASVQTSPDKDLNPIAAGAAAAIPFILAAVF